MSEITSTTENTPKGHTVVQKHPHQVARRNARERNRVRQVNMGFVTLRNCVPAGAKNKKLSKVETLRQAAHYIQYLQELLTSSTSPDSTTPIDGPSYYPTPTAAQPETSTAINGLSYGYGSSENFGTAGTYFSPYAQHQQVSGAMLSQDFSSGIMNMVNSAAHQTFSNYGSGMQLDFTGAPEISIHQSVQQNKISPQNNTSDPSPSSSFLSDASSYDMTLSPQELKYSNAHNFVAYS